MKSRLFVFVLLSRVFCAPMTTALVIASPIRSYNLLVVLGTLTNPNSQDVLEEESEEPVGGLEQSIQAYDKKVAGIVSGAGNFKPALVLDKKTGKTETKRIPIALMGKVCCKVDATSSSIEIGDLLTTSTTKGHAMKAEDPFKAFGAVIGKALGSIEERLGIIPVLVALQ